MIIGYLYLNVVLSLSVFQKVVGQCGPSDAGWRYWPEGKSCYLVTTHIKTSWSSAQDRCEQNGANLLSVSNQQEWDIVTALFNVVQTQEVWIGLRKNTRKGRPPRLGSRQNLRERRRGWRWSDGKPYVWRRWYDHPRISNSQPSGRHECGLVKKSDRTDWNWYDGSCTNYHHFVCKKHADRSAESSTLLVPSTESTTTTSTISSGLGPSSTSMPRKENAWLGLAIGIPIGGVLFCVVLAVVFLWILRKNARKKQDQADALKTHNTRERNELETSDHHYLELCRDSVQIPSAPPQPKGYRNNEYDYINTASRYLGSHPKTNGIGNDVGKYAHCDVGNKPTAYNSNEYEAVGEHANEEHLYSHLQ